jgi:hypothetical protein
MGGPIMKSLQRLFVLIGALALVNLVTWFVVTGNQNNAIYPMDGDSIAIPLFSTFLASLIVSPFFAVIALMPTARCVAALCSRSTTWSVAVGLILLVAYVATAGFLVMSAAYWAIPYHYPITFSYSLLLAGLVALLVTDARRLFPKFSFKLVPSCKH